MFGLDEVRGGSGYGAGTFAGATGARQPSSNELKQAEHQVRQMLQSKMLVGHLCGCLLAFAYMLPYSLSHVSNVVAA